MSLVMKIKDMKQLLKRSLTDLKAAREELAAVKARNVSLTAALADKCKGCEYLETDKRYMNEYMDKLKDSEAELAALKEKYRWRKQSEEPAPHTYDKVLWVSLYEYDCGGIFDWEGRVCCSQCVSKAGDVFWRPLDLPEEIDKP